MKKTVFLLLMLFIASMCFAQNVTKFMGIPVDGTKSAMVQKLKGKGFTYDVKNDVLKGEFNGDNVLISVQTVNRKVWRIAVSSNGYNETQVKINFNRLCQQFERNSKYVSLVGAESQEIGDNENISYEMAVNSKRYEATYLQDGDEMRLVWFAIFQEYNNYYIYIFYENLYNAANGEDL